MNTDQPAVACRHCGATAKPGQPYCWLCFSPAEPAEPADVSPKVPQSASPAASHADSSVTDSDQVNPFQLGAQIAAASATDSAVTLAVTLLLLLTIFTVGFSLYQSAPGAAILFGLFVVVPLVRTMMVSQSRTNRGKPPGLSRRIQMFVTSMAVMFGLLVLWLLSAIIGFVVLCFAVAGISSSGGNADIAMFVFGGGYLLVVLFLTFKLVASRYRSDVDRD